MLAAALPDAAPAPPALAFAQRFALGSIPVLFSAAVFYPITRNFFSGDDFFHLYTIADRGFVDFVLTPFGGHMLVARNALFYLCYVTFGTVAERYFCLVLLTHLLNVWLLFRTVAVLTASLPLACFAATLWGAAPVHGETLGWYSVYGEVVCTTLLLVVLLGLACRAEGTAPVRSGVVLLWSLLAIVASTCFGEGMAIAGVFPLVVPLFVPLQRIRIPGRILLPCVPLAVAALYVWINRRFDAESASPVPVFTIIITFASFGRLIFEMWRDLLTYGASALVLGFFGSPAAYPGPASLVAAGVYAAALVVGMVRGGSHGRRHLTALVLLAAAPYAAIAVGRAALYSAYTTDLAQPATAERYHYLTLVPLAIALAVALRYARTLRRLPLRGGTLPLALGLCTMLAGFLLFPPAIDHHDADRQATNFTLASIRAQMERSAAGPAVLPNAPFGPTGLLGMHFPGTAGLYMIYHPTNVLDGRRIHFAVTPKEYADAVRAGGRLPTLLLPRVTPSG